MVISVIILELLVGDEPMRKNMIDHRPRSLAGDLLGDLEDSRIDVLRTG
jgi:hypothetical protein